MKLQTKLFIALAAGLVVGAFSRFGFAIRLQALLILLEPIGTAFIRLVTMVVVPLVVASLFVGIASVGDVRRLGRISGRTLGWFTVTTFLAATIGLVVAMVSGVGLGLDDATRQTLSNQIGAMDQAMITGATASTPAFVQMVIELIPQNLVASASRGDLLPLIIGVCLFAAAATVIAPERRARLVSACEALNDTAMVVVGWLMHAAPVAVFILIAAMVARSGTGLLLSLVGYVAVVLLGMFLHIGLVLLPALRFVAKQGIGSFFRATSDALTLAFSTASSSATLPVSMAAARDRLGVSADVVGFVLPAGATLNKNGAAIYKAVTAVYIARLYGVDPDGAVLITIVLTSMVAAFAGAGVPGSSLVTTMIVLNAIGLGPGASAGIALVTGIDRPLDMCRTAVNTLGNLVGTVSIGRKEAATTGRPMVPQELGG
jgi:Na+/H+-dicarboxylate symporter